jgi:hypothetical protein
MKCSISVLTVQKSHFLRCKFQINSLKTELLQNYRITAYDHNYLTLGLMMVLVESRNVATTIFILESCDN